RPGHPEPHWYLGCACASLPSRSTRCTSSANPDQGAIGFLLTMKVARSVVPLLPWAVTEYFPVGSVNAVWYVALTVPSVVAVCGAPEYLPLGDWIVKMIVSPGNAPVTFKVNASPWRPCAGFTTSASGNGGGIDNR